MFCVCARGTDETVLSGCGDEIGVAAAAGAYVAAAADAYVAAAAALDVGKIFSAVVAEF